MPAKWQKWMPFHIDSFYGSPWVQAMHPAAQAGYLKLLAAQWHTDECTLPADDDDLAILSGLGKWELWEEHSKTILRHFAKLDNSRIQNSVCFREWLEAKRVFEARQNGGKGKTPARLFQESSKSLATVQEQSTKRAYTRTETGTVTKTEKQKPSGKPEAESRHNQFHEQIDRYWKHKTGEEKAPWDGSEAKALSALLAAKPDLTLEQFRLALKHRGDSPDEVHTERPRQWLGNVLRFLQSPLDRYGRPIQQAKASVLQLRSVTMEEAMQR